MKIATWMAALFAAVMMMTGCADKSEAANPNIVQLDPDLPAWVMNPTVDNGIGVAGLSKYSKHGMTVMMPKAETDARMKLAAEIQTEVSALTKKAMRQANINEIDDFEEQFSSVTKQVVKKIPLSGAQRIAMYQDKKTGELWVHMVIQKREIGKFLAENAASVKQQMAEAKMTRERLDDAGKVLDTMIKDLDDETAE